MYIVSNLNRLAIISVDEVIASIPSDMNPSVTHLEKSIVVAEERVLKPAMCFDFYYELRGLKNKIVTDGNKAELQSKFQTGTTLSVGEVVNAIELVENEKYREWWNEFGVHIAANAVMYMSTPMNWLRTTSAGEVLNSPKTLVLDAKGSTSGDLKDVQWKMNKLFQDWIDPLIAASDEWLCKNKQYFPNYNCKKCADCGCGESASGNVTRKSAWINLYDD